MIGEMQNHITAHHIQADNTNVALVYIRNCHNACHKQESSDAFASPHGNENQEVLFSKKRPSRKTKIQSNIL